MNGNEIKTHWAKVDGVHKFEPKWMRAMIKLVIMMMVQRLPAASNTHLTQPTPRQPTKVLRSSPTRPDPYTQDQFPQYLYTSSPTLECPPCVLRVSPVSFIFFHSEHTAVRFEMSGPGRAIRILWPGCPQPMHTYVFLKLAAGNAAAAGRASRLPGGRASRLPGTQERLRLRTPLAALTPVT